MMHHCARTDGHAGVKLPCRAEGSGARSTTARFGREPRATGSARECGGKVVGSCSGSTWDPQVKVACFGLPVRRQNRKKALAEAQPARLPDPQALSYTLLTMEYY